MLLLLNPLLEGNTVLALTGILQGANVNTRYLRKFGSTAMRLSVSL